MSDEAGTPTKCCLWSKETGCTQIFETEEAVAAAMESGLWSDEPVEVAGETQDRKRKKT